MDKISVIVPCYNAENYLEQCLRSLISQTYKHLEIICVDDGSTDGTLQLLNSFRNKDSRIKVINQKNQGISSARNLALKNATGTYVSFVDADDWLDVDTLESMMQYKDEDLICFSYYRNFDQTEIIKNLGLEGAFSASEIQKRMVGLTGEELKHIASFDALITCWGKLYKKESLHNIKFLDLKEIGTWEDGLFNLQVLENITTVRIIDKPYYHYRKVHLGTYTSTYKEGLYHKWIYKFNLIKTFMIKNNKPSDFFTALNNRISVTYLNLIFNEMSSNKSFTGKIETLRFILGHPVYREAFRSLDLKHIPHVWKVFYYFAKYNSALITGILGALIYKIASLRGKK